MVGDARVSDSVRARGVSSRMDKDSGRVVGVMVCHWPDVDGDEVIIVVCGSLSGGVLMIQAGV